LEDALRLLQLPRTVGADPETGEEVIAANGKFGPYLKRGSETRSLESEDQLFTVTIEQAVSLFSEPKQRRYGTTAAPLRELGPDPESGSPIVLRSGRFGPYVTDGTTNASLRRGDDPDALTAERAAELIADRRAAGPSKRAGARKSAGAKKAGPRKAAGAKKAVARKAVGTKTQGAKKAGARKALATKRAPATKKAAGVTTTSSRGAAAKKAATRRAPGAALRSSASPPAPADDW
jgi:DNA topoisomerase-1